MPAIIGMKRISLPLIGETEGGLAGIILIAESHIAVHTWSKEGKLLADVFSCLAFDSAPVLARLMLDFEVKSLYPKVLQRGLEYLSSPQQ